MTARRYDPFNYVRTAYGVPAKKGARIEYTGSGARQLGTITGVDGAHVLIRLDCKAHASPYHPTWELKYIPTQDA